MIEVRPPRPREADAALDLALAHYGSPLIETFGASHDIRALPCLIAVMRHTPLGAVYYTIEGDWACIVALTATPKRRGTGSALVLGLARTLSRHATSEPKITRLRMAVATDNEAAVGFCQARGWRAVARHIADAKVHSGTGAGAKTRAHEEIEFAYDLATAVPQP